MESGHGLDVPYMYMTALSTTTTCSQFVALNACQLERFKSTTTRQKTRSHDGHVHTFLDDIGHIN